MGIKMMGRLKAILGLAISLVGIGTGGAVAEPFRLILTHLEPPLVPNSVMDLALELGYFEREGVEVELIRVQQTPSALAALQAGEGEMANVGVDALLQLVARGADDLKAVASPNTSLPFLIAARTEFATPQDLEGRRFGVGRIGSIDHALSMNVLDSAGVDTDSLEVLSLGQPNVRAQALAAGQIDATTMSVGVWLALPEKDALTVVIDQADYFAAAPVVNKVNVVPQAVLDARGDEVEAVLRALIEISRDFAAEPTAWVDAMEAVLSTVTRDELVELVGTFESSWSVNGGMNATDLAYTQDWMYQTEDFADTPPVDLADWTDFSVLDTILADIGIEDAADLPQR
jgi:NitT/TauT family transport system substrate-binding protein